ncbi:hypothetical protein Ancab_007719 [Ancistrocladus abbreviatus]
MSNENSNPNPAPANVWRGRDDDYNLPIHFTRTPPWRGPGYDDPAPSWENGQTGWHHGDTFPWFSRGRAPDAIIVAPRPFDERIPRRPFGFTRFTFEPYSPPRYVILDNMAPEASTRPSLFAAPELPPRYTGEGIMHIPMQHEESKLTREEQVKALKMLRREFYSPTIKMLARRVSQHYEDINSANTSLQGMGKDIDDDVKRCVICLEDFELRCEVTITPCEHIFHEECIVPWVKSHGQCPICRFAFCDRIRESEAGLNNSRRVPPVYEPFSAFVGAFPRWRPR